MSRQVVPVRKGTYTVLSNGCSLVAAVYESETGAGRTFIIVTVLAPPGEKTPDDLGQALLDRNEARWSMDCARADAIEEGLLAQGIVLQDVQDGVQWARR